MNHFKLWSCRFLKPGIAVDLALALALAMEGAPA